MPIDIYGNRADIITEASSVASRMNAGRIYEIYFNAMSRHAKAMVINWLAFERTHEPKVNTDALPIPNTPKLKPLENYSDEVINAAFSIIVDLLSIIGTEQYYAYRDVKDRERIELLINDVIEEELYLYYKISSNKKPYQIVRDVMQTPYRPIRSKVYFEQDGKIKMSHDDVRIAPLYTILLGKTADNFLSAASAKTNHYGVPIGIGNKAKNQLPWRNVPVKIISETESRLYIAYVSRLGMAELKDRGNSISTHAEIYKNILSADKPANINRVVDRKKVPYGSDAAMQLIDSIFSSCGISIEYVHDHKKLHPYVG